MNSIQAREPRSSAPRRRVAVVVRNAWLVLLGLLVGALIGLAVAGFAGWWPGINLC